MNQEKPTPDQIKQAQLNDSEEQFNGAFLEYWTNRNDDMMRELKHKYMSGTDSEKSSALEEMLREVRLE